MKLGTILYLTAQNLRRLRPGVSSGAFDATTFLDDARSEPDGFFNGGTVFILSGPNAGRSARVAKWELVTHKIFYAPAFDTGVGVGVSYALADKKYSRSHLVQAVNTALLFLGPFDQTNQSLSTIDRQAVYNLPEGVSNVRRVQIATCAEEPYQWAQPYRYWSEQNGKLYLDDAHLPPGGLPMLIHYSANHARVEADADLVSDAAAQSLIAWQAAFEAASMLSTTAGTSDPEPRETMAIAAKTLQELKPKHPVRRMQQDGRWPAWIPPQERW